jgi:DNA primase
MIPFAEINRRLLPRALSLLQRWAPEGIVRGNEYICRCPWRSDKSVGSFSVNLTTGTFYDFATKEAGRDLITFYAKCNGINNSDAARELQYL